MKGVMIKQKENDGDKTMHEKQKENDKNEWNGNERCMIK